MQVSTTHWPVLHLSTAHFSGHQSIPRLPTPISFLPSFPPKSTDHGCTTPAFVFRLQCTAWCSLHQPHERTALGFGAEQLHFSSLSVQNTHCCWWLRAHESLRTKLFILGDDCFSCSVAGTFSYSPSNHPKKLIKLEHVITSCYTRLNGFVCRLHTNINV